MIIKRILFTLALIFGGSAPVLACGGDNFDREAELRAIRNAVPKTQMNLADKERVRDLLDKASVPTKSLRFEGLRLQSKYRGEAIKLLGLPRVLKRPDREFEAVDAALRSPSTPEDKIDMAAKLRVSAESLWAANNFDKSRAALNEAMNILNVKVVNLRC